LLANRAVVLAHNQKKGREEYLEIVKVKSGKRTNQTKARTVGKEEGGNK